MALKVKCKCGTFLKVPSAMADKRVSCPNCKTGFILPAARFAAHGAAKKTIDSNTSAAGGAGSAATAHAARTAAGTPSRKPAASAAATPLPAASAAPIAAAATMPLGAPADPAELDLTPSNLDLELIPSSDDLLGDLNLVGGDPEPLPSVNINQVATAAAYAPDRTARVSSSRLTDPISGPKRGYWADAFYSFVYPFQSGGNVATFLVICAIACLNIPLGFVGGFGLIPSLIIFGWMRAMYLSVVQETAGGSEDLPGIRMEDGFLEDIIKPAIRYIGAYACALLPTVGYLVAMALGILPASMASPVTLLLWLAAGIFLWPMFVILFAFNASAYVIRLDMIASTIFRTILPYLAMWLMLMLVGLISILPFLGVIVAMMGLNINVPEIPVWGGMAGDAVMIMLDVYFSIVSMRIIGLYYLHFKRRFTMTFE